TGAAALGRGVTHDDEFLPQAALELDPVRAAAGHVRTAEAFADDALQRKGAGRSEDVRVAILKCGREPHQPLVVARHNLLQLSPALFHRQAAHVAPVEKRGIKYVVDDVVTAADLEGPLQGLKIRQAL